jgi:hypothetical protein
MILLRSAITARGNTQKGYARKATRHGQLQVINDLNGIEVCKACRSARHSGLQRMHRMDNACSSARHASVCVGMCDVEPTISMQQDIQSDIQSGNDTHTIRAGCLTCIRLSGTIWSTPSSCCAGPSNRSRPPGTSTRPTVSYAVHVAGSRYQLVSELYCMLVWTAAPVQTCPQRHSVPKGIHSVPKGNSVPLGTRRSAACSGP